MRTLRRARVEAAPVVAYDGTDLGPVDPGRASRLDMMDSAVEPIGDTIVGEGATVDGAPCPRVRLADRLGPVRVTRSGPRRAPGGIR
jgi:hypothetical protein